MTEQPGKVIEKGRVFNITGTCIPRYHFMADMSKKLDRIAAMVERGEYFTIDRPRQYGKTTTMYQLQQRLLKDKKYLVLDISLERIPTQVYQQEKRFITTLMNLWLRRLQFLQEDHLKTLMDKSKKTVSNFETLDLFISEMVQPAGRKVVLMIDEVDKAANYQLFLDFLGMLRTKYLEQREGKDVSFFSVILAGVHDIKSLKSKIRRENGKVYNSPWNIAVQFDVDLSLSPGEITSMLNDYSRERNINIDMPFFAEKLFYFTAGYPFLVSCLCKIIDEKILPLKSKKKWEPQDLVEAVRAMLMENNTNFDILVKNLENNPDLYQLVYRIIMDGNEFSYNPRNPVIHMGTMYGILRREEGKIRIHNRVYEQLIYDYMSSKLETGDTTKFHTITTSYIETDGTLNILKIIRQFQRFIKEQYSVKDVDFLERNGRLLFLAFIRPIINGKGFDFKEVQISEEKRLDIVVTFLEKKYIIELKIWRGEAYHKAGIEQLFEYLDRQDETQGYLLIFDLRKESGRLGECETLQKCGKTIFAAWV